MPWVRLEDTFYDHPKILGAPLPVVGLNTLAICYASAKLTDGRLTPAMVRYLGGTPKLTDELVRRGLWEIIEGGWQIHDFLDYNPSRVATIERREIRAEAGRRGGLASGATRHGRSNDEANTEQHANQTRSKPEANTSANAKQTRSKIEPRPVPVPVPVREPTLTGSDNSLPREAEASSQTWFDDQRSSSEPVDEAAGARR